MKKIFSNAGAQILGKIGTALISIFLIRLLTEYLSVEGFGLYSKIYNYLSIFATIADLGLYTIAVREMAKAYADRDNQRFDHISGNILTLRTLGGGLIIILSLLIALTIPGYHSAIALTCIAITGVFTLFGLINSSILATLQSRLTSEFSLVSTIMGKVVTLAGIGLLILWLPTDSPWFAGWSLIAVMIIGLLGNIVMTLMLYLYARERVRISFSYDPGFIRDIIRETLPFGIALFLGVIYFKVDIILLSLLESAEIHDRSIGLYSMAMKLVEVGMIFGTVYLNSLLPVLSDQYIKRGDRAHHIHTAGLLMLLAGGALSLGLYFVAFPIITLLGGESYTSALPYSSVDALRISAFVFVTYFLISLTNYLLIAEGRQKELLKLNLIGTLINIGGNILLIPHLSFIGAAISTLISQLLLLALSTLRISRDDLWNYTPQRAYLIIASNLIMSAVLGYLYIHYVTEIEIFSSGMIFSLLFGLSFLPSFYTWWRYYTSHHTLSGVQNTSSPSSAL